MIQTSSKVTQVCNLYRWNECLIPVLRLLILMHLIHQFQTCDIIVIFFWKNRSKWNYLFFNDIERELNLEVEDSADEAESVDTTKKTKKEVMTKML